MGKVLSFPSGVACKDCGEQISMARRKALPGCTRCDECQREREDDIKRARFFSRPSDIEIIRG
jgi:ArsR family metal-binding transcriptional regulator